MALHRRTLIAILAAALLVAPAASAASGSRAGATRAAERRTIAYVKRFGITLRAVDLDLECRSPAVRAGSASSTPTADSAPGRCARCTPRAR
jgi:hypothetical protein